MRWPSGDHDGPQLPSGGVIIRKPDPSAPTTPTALRFVSQQPGLDENARTEPSGDHTRGANSPILRPFRSTSTRRWVPSAFMIEIVQPPVEFVWATYAMWDPSGDQAGNASQTSPPPPASSLGAASARVGITYKLPSKSE